MIVGLWIGVSLYFFLDGWRSGKPSLLSCWGLAAAVALNVLTKGLIGIVFPGAIIFVFLVMAGDLRHLFKMRLFSSSIVFLVIAAPWHVLAAIANPPAGETRGSCGSTSSTNNSCGISGSAIRPTTGRFPFGCFTDCCCYGCCVERFPAAGPG